MDHLYQEIVSFQRRCNDFTDNKEHSLARTLQQEVQRLEDEAQVRKNPRSLDDRVKRIMGLLEETEEHQVMSHAHADELIDHCEEFRKELRKLF